MYKRMITIKPNIQKAKGSHLCYLCIALQHNNRKNPTWNNFTPLPAVYSMNSLYKNKKAYFCTSHAAQRVLFFMDSIYIGPYDLECLENKPTISQGQFDDLKIEYNYRGRMIRVWLSRMTIADGMPYDNQVTIEQYSHKEGAWIIKEQYQAL